MRDEIYSKPVLTSPGYNEFILFEKEIEEIKEEVINPKIDKELISAPNILKKIKLLIATPTNKNLENDM
jgi:hypothetical protein